MAEDSEDQHKTIVQDDRTIISHASSLKSEKMGEFSKNASRKTSMSSIVYATTRLDQGRAEDFFEVGSELYVGNKGGPEQQLNICKSINE